jgi:P4 family phage/plasmid primase-like protien
VIETTILDVSEPEPEKEEVVVDKGVWKKSRAYSFRKNNYDKLLAQYKNVRDIMPLNERIFAVSEFYGHGIKNNKIPHFLVNGKLVYGKSNDATTWMLFDEAFEVFKNSSKDGLYSVACIGMFMDQSLNINCFDMDYFMVDGVLKGENQENTLNFFVDMGCYVEESWSGKGFHAVYTLEQQLDNINHKIKQNFGTKEDSDILGVEMYTWGRYLTLTGKMVSKKVPLLSKIDHIKLSEYLKEKFPLFWKNKERKKSKEDIFSIDIGQYIKNVEFLDEEVIERIESSDTEGARRFLGYHSGTNYDKYKDNGETPDWSALIRSYLSTLGWWTGYNSAQMDRIFRTSVLFIDSENDRQKADSRRGNQTWLESEIESIINQRTSNGYIDNKPIKQSLCDGKYGQAKLFSILKKEHLVYDIVEKKWYQYMNDIWVRKGDISMLLRDTLYYEYGGYTISLMEYVKKMQEKGASSEAIKHIDTYISLIQNVMEELNDCIQKWILCKEVENEGFLGRTDIEWDNVPPFHLPFNNGLLNMITEELIPYRPDMYITCKSDIDWVREKIDTTAPYTIMRQIMGEGFEDSTSTELTDFMFENLGYAISGNPKYELFQIWQGPGSDGKDTILLALKELLKLEQGLYYVTSKSTYSVKGSGGPSPEIVNIRGKRIVEIPEGSNKVDLDDGLVKQTSSRGTLSGRNLYKSDIKQFNPVSQCIMTCNPLPNFSITDGGLWRRILLIQFPVQFTKNAVRSKNQLEINEDIKDVVKTKEFVIAFAKLCVSGFQRVYWNGLQIPKSITKDTEKYRFRMDTMHDFFEEHFDLDVNGRIRRSDFNRAYQYYRAQLKFRPVGNITLHNELDHLINKFDNLKVMKYNGSMYIFGIRIKNIYDAYSTFYHSNEQNMEYDPMTKVSKFNTGMKDLQDAKNIQKSIEEYNKSNEEEQS